MESKARKFAKMLGEEGKVKEDFTSTETRESIEETKESLQDAHAGIKKNKSRLLLELGIV